MEDAQIMLLMVRLKYSPSSLLTLAHGLTYSVLLIQTIVHSCDYKGGK